MNELSKLLSPVRHGLMMGILALIFGALWAAYIATHHEPLHGGFEAAAAKIKQVQMRTDMSMDRMDMEAMEHPHSAGTSPSHHATKEAAHGNHSAHTAGEQHSHSGSLSKDAMQRLLRGHIHFMGIGLLTMVMLILIASTSLKEGWKKVFGWTFGLGALMYPPAWILMGFRTVELGPQAAEASVLWLFGPAVGLLLASLIATLVIFLLETCGMQRKIPVVKSFFEK